MRGDCGLSVFGPPSGSPVVKKCVCCDRRLLRNETIPCVGCCRNAVSKDLVAVIAVCVSGMYVQLDKESHRRGRVFSARSI